MDKSLIKKLVGVYLLILPLIWGYLIWDFFQGRLLFSSPPDRILPMLFLTFFVSGMTLFFLLGIIGMCFFVYHDAGRRGMNRLLWTLITIFTPNLLGIVIYLLLRRPVLTRCAGCQTRLDTQLLHCPNCGLRLKQKCPSCSAIVESHYKFCGTCGTLLVSAQLTEANSSL